MRNKIKRLNVLLGLVLGALTLVAPVVMPFHANVAFALESAEYPDVPQNHWAYATLNRLSHAGLIDGMPNDTYMGNNPMTRYEFAVAIARILDKVAGERYAVSTAPQNATGDRNSSDADAIMRKYWKNRHEWIDYIQALCNEFAPELKALGVHVDEIEKRLAFEDVREGLRTPSQRLTIPPNMLFGGSANSISTEKDSKANPKNQQSSK
jgi:hypothetical protein